MTESTSLLSVAGLSKSYGGLSAVDDVSFEIAKGEVVGLVGPNGAGKSTIVDLICGAQRPDRGSVAIDGMQLKGAAATRARKGGLSRTFQHPHLALDLSIRENLAIGVAALRLGSVTSMLKAFCLGVIGLDVIGAHEYALIEETADALGLEKLERPVGDLTLGEMRLVEVARSVLQSPKVLLLDEPFAGSDAHGVERVLEALVRVSDTQNCSILLIDHNVDLVARVCTRLILLNMGKVAYDAPTKDCLNSEVMHEVYFTGAGSE
jgi:branched-chain amino acid transport system ATP-binding protein